MPVFNFSLQILFFLGLETGAWHVETQDIPGYTRGYLVFVGTQKTPSSQVFKIINVTNLYTVSWLSQIVVLPI